MPLIRMLDATENIPDTTSTLWVSKAAKDFWCPVIAEISSIWREVELTSVLERVREAAILNISPDEMVGFSKRVISNNIYMTILGKSADTGMYSSRHTEPIGKFTYRIAIHKHPEYFEDTQIQAIDRLGYPMCCVANFDTWWNREHYFDLTWPQYENSNQEFSPFCNVLLKCLGVRPVFHLPCGFHCESTIKIAHDIQDLMMAYGMARIADNIKHLCDMPMEWSALHGYAEIRTPIFKIVTKTDATPEEYKFQKPGIFMPVHGASGLAFPFRNTQNVKLTETVSFHKSLETLSHPPEDNGFPSEKAESDAHNWLMKEIERFMNPSETRTLIDLGCGNGKLLQHIRRRFPNFNLGGIDISLDKCQKARTLLGKSAFVDCKNIFQYGSIQKDYILVAEQRFHENHHLKDKLNGYVICYNYTTRRVYTWSSALTGEEILKLLIGFGNSTIQNSLASQIQTTKSSPVSLIVEKELKDSALLSSLRKDSL